MKRHWLIYVAVGAGLVIAAIVGFIAFQSLEISSENSTYTNSPPPASGCCADITSAPSPP
jgi:hypothetical protein